MVNRSKHSKDKQKGMVPTSQYGVFHSLGVSNLVHLTKDKSKKKKSNLAATYGFNENEMTPPQHQKDVHKNFGGKISKTIFTLQYGNISLSLST